MGTLGFRAWVKAAVLFALAAGVSPHVTAQSVRNPHGPIAIACENCHTQTSWAPLRAQPEFNHGSQSRFPLRGMHESVACNSCHVSKVFTDAPVECANCHADFHRGQFGANCESCHTVRGWKAATQVISGHQNRFPLLGAHGALACDSCHTNAAAGVYIGLNTSCSSCHLPQFQQTKTVNHQAAGFSQACESCHNVNQWAGAQFNHAATRFPLTGKHTSATCATCHVSGQFKALPTECVSCHQADFSKTSNPNHTQAGFPVTCESCHTTLQWQGATFDHGTFTGFALVGAHANSSCVSCHVNGKFVATSSTCSSCHLPDFEASKNPNHRASNFSTQCETCHTSTQWAGAKFDHSLARFPLTGKHTSVECASCHKSGQFTGTPSTCVNCHQAQFDATVNPNHKEAGFPQTCESCHTTAQWAGARFDHSATKFPLTGKHTSATCASCHVGGQFNALPTSCSSCHLPDFQKTTNPNHAASGFPQACETCHSTTQWAGAKFDHNSNTKFPLTGKHTATACASCHVGGKFAGLGQSCSTCHLPEFQKTTDPNHASAGFSQTCETCHTTTQWKGAVFNHSTTKFPLTGKHTAAACASCHVGGKFSGLGTACSTCHLPDFQKTTNPNHASAGLSQTCETCHTTTQWKGAVFNHSATKFPLTGKHTTTACASCHVGGKFAGLPTACSTCHLPDYQGAKNPSHAGFPQTCESCHSTISWSGANFNHNTTKFPLTGKHTAAACATCHVGGKFAGLGTECATCHLPEFQKTTNPNHAAAGFSQNCAFCHTTVQWPGAQFDHGKTRFPLTGKHTATTCATCHVGGKFAGLGTTCSTCHLPDYQAAKNPSHAGFPQTCESCHTTSSWSGANFNHSTTKFPLTGKHTAAACASCHVGGKFAGLGTTCSTCHLPDYQGAKNPNHAGFPQTCESCHTTASWSGANFNHNATKFPLTGKHTAATCASCHVGGKFAGLGTACSTCHLPDFQKTTNQNHASAGFSQSCETCHTTTQWAGAKFNHSATKFPLTGKHSSATCASCHVGGKFTGLGTACSTCHLPDYQGAKNPSHAGFPQTCESCHTTASWSGANFNHNATKFPLTGKHTAATCASCHVGGKFAGLGTACSTCHLPKFQATTNPNHAAAGFSQACETCHTTTQWTGAAFNHSATKFPLTGKHTSATCASCHVGGKYTGLGTACSTCHLPQYQAAKNPSHAGFPQNCESCHSTTSWSGASFNHSATRFPLTGKHTAATCASCHVGGKFAGLGTACSACHLPQYQATKTPDHAAAKFSQACETCHTTTQWTGATFNHNTTRFPLTGKHAAASCATCHVNNVFTGLGTACSTCHLPAYQAARNPSHTGLPTTCETCHNSTAWTPASFNHRTTRFPLTGKHTAATCASCHVGGKFAGLGTACSTCHLPKFQATTNPNHVAAGFPQDCSLCHSTAQWTGATFNHSTTQFPLTGKHTTVVCASCHVNNQYSTLPTTCVSCHLAKFQATTNPNHVTAGFPQTCETCHSTTQWTGATFNHTTFPLTGKHTTVACASCHVGGVYKGTSKDCYTCHRTAYNTTTNPNHAAAGFPTTCATCHTTTQWRGATFNHTWFPITTGAHKNVACLSCHPNSTNYTVFSCTTGCHPANNTNNDHRGVRNYVYNSANCYACHPQGRE